MKREFLVQVGDERYTAPLREAAEVIAKARGGEVKEVWSVRTAEGLAQAAAVA